MKKDSSGITLVEVLVSIVILAIGLLGTAGLMSASVRSTNTAYYRSLATFLADDIIDRMRANVAAARNGDYNVEIGATVTAGASMASIDGSEWKTALANSLPGGDGRIRVDNNGASVIIQWNDGSFTTNSQL